MDVVIKTSNLSIPAKVHKRENKFLVLANAEEGCSTLVRSEGSTIESAVEAFIQALTQPTTK
ncbi:hypothetical protein NVP1024O_60 [Vibrio phage 1.024.O._10N.261.45.F8]|nr:hypothetical protein NVP1024O_60 [Vibrio phage 1.024.O._10N.261.45.F8]AUS01467.1 hypothetical protein NVP1285O_69 [Vibrio phage 1.285.O._10N.286.55.C12]